MTWLQLHLYSFLINIPAPIYVDCVRLSAWLPYDPASFPRSAGFGADAVYPETAYSKPLTEVP